MTRTPQHTNSSHGVWNDTTHAHTLVHTHTHTLRRYLRTKAAKRCACYRWRRNDRQSSIHTLCYPHELRASLPVGMHRRRVDGKRDNSTRVATETDVDGAVRVAVTVTVTATVTITVTDTKRKVATVPRADVRGVLCGR